MDNSIDEYDFEPPNMTKDKSEQLTHNMLQNCLTETPDIQDTDLITQPSYIGIFNSQSFYYNLLIFIFFSINGSYHYYNHLEKAYSRLIAVLMTGAINAILNYVLIDSLSKQSKYFTTFSSLIENHLGFLSSVIFDIFSCLWYISNIITSSLSSLTLYQSLTGNNNPHKFIQKFIYAIVFGGINGTYCSLSKFTLFKFNLVLKGLLIILLIIVNTF